MQKCYIYFHIYRFKTNLFQFLVKWKEVKVHNQDNVKIRSTEHLGCTSKMSMDSTVQIRNAQVKLVQVHLLMKTLEFLEGCCELRLLKYLSRWCWTHPRHCRSRCRHRTASAVGCSGCSCIWTCRWGRCAGLRGGVSRIRGKKNDKGMTMSNVVIMNINIVIIIIMIRIFIAILFYNVWIVLLEINDIIMATVILRFYFLTNLILSLFWWFVIIFSVLHLYFPVHRGHLKISHTL